MLSFAAVRVFINIFQFMLDTFFEEQFLEDKSQLHFLGRMCLKEGREVLDIQTKRLVQWTFLIEQLVCIQEYSVFHELIVPIACFDATIQFLERKLKSPMHARGRK